MVSADAARTVVGIIGNIIALILFLSPVPTFTIIWKKKSVEQFSPVPYLATLFNCGMWILYGLPWFHPHSFLVLTINGSGFVIELVYLMIFLIYSDKKKRKNVMLIALAELAFVGVVALMVLTLVDSMKLRTTIIGSICMVGCFLMYASPLAVMKLVITTKSVEYMPFFLSLFSFLNGVAWTAYALIKFDPYIAAPNGLGALLGVAQLILYATFYKSTKQQMAAKQSKVELGLSDQYIAPVSSTDPKKLQNGAHV
ncbi:hypothetical protein DCAR_0207334 [Daucus carota subsp. sativus]|uniref:Bidirectional sugar transporter SWEET n=1 Tax=Daucus carota subsp. sativus TaxID=79200 RepID=A0A166DTU5_DAUCS|nr:PREDICTED: bidirectional sugar transporter SWEET4-like [Daucus carota subsp. sativus]WOG88100.1 hypothetical protein DCAR_0207334 [Daucus carota subsp. sativus]